MSVLTGTASNQIAGQIRDKIKSGELAAGDRVPSTREIMRRWGVAMATASKVLSILKEEGLVRTRPGAGTVVAKASSSRARSKRPSSRHRSDTDQGTDRVGRDRGCRQGRPRCTVDAPRLRSSLTWPPCRCTATFGTRTTCSL